MLQRLWLSCTRRSGLMLDCGACQHCALYSTGKVCRRCFSEENSCDLCRPDLTEESYESSVRVRARNDKNTSLRNFNCFVWVRDEVSWTNKALCIQRNEGEHSVRDSNYFCNIPTKFTCTIKYMYYYQHSPTFNFTVSPCILIHRILYTN